MAVSLWTHAGTKVCRILYDGWPRKHSCALPLLFFGVLRSLLIAIPCPLFVNTGYLRFTGLIRGNGRFRVLPFLE